MTSSWLALAAPAPRWRRCSLGLGLRSCSWTRTNFRAIKSCRPIRSIRQASTFSTSWVSATQSARWRRRHISCGCGRTTPSSTLNFLATEPNTVLGDDASTVSCRMRQRRLESRSSTERGSPISCETETAWSACEPPGRQATTRNSGRASWLAPTAVTPRSRDWSMRRSTLPMTVRERCSGGTGMLRPSGAPIQPIRSGCTSRIPMATSASSFKPITISC